MRTKNSQNEGQASSGLILRIEPTVEVFINSANTAEERKLTALATLIRPIVKFFAAAYRGELP